MSRSATRPSASVLFLAYNHEAFAEQALRSALGQEGPPFELVVVDDASTDRTREIVDRVLREAAPAGLTVHRIYKERNGGLLAAVNDAMAVATGEIFLMMAGDDVAVPDRLARTLAVFDRAPEVQLVYGEFVKIDAKGRRYASVPGDGKPRLHSYDVAAFSRIYAGASPFGASAAYRRRLFEEFGPMSLGTHGEDNCFWIRALLLGQIHHEPACFVEWRQHTANMSNFAGTLADPDWRRRHLAWMELHAGMSRQWLLDIRHAHRRGLISWGRASRLRLAALREDATWGLEASSLRQDAWPTWWMRAFRMLALGRISTTLKMLKLRVFRQRQARRWQFWAKLKLNSPL